MAPAVGLLGMQVRRCSLASSSMAGFSFWTPPALCVPLPTMKTTWSPPCCARGHSAQQRRALHNHRKKTEALPRTVCYGACLTTYIICSPLACPQR